MLLFEITWSKRLLPFVPLTLDSLSYVHFGQAMSGPKATLVARDPEVGEAEAPPMDRAHTAAVSLADCDDWAVASAKGDF